MIGAGGLAGDLAGASLGPVFDAAASWVGHGAQWLLDRAGATLDTTTAVPLGTPWFARHQAVMAATAAAVMVPMVCAAVLQGVWRQSPGLMGRAVLVQLPMALLLTAVVVVLVRLGLALTDTLSAQVLRGAGADSRDVLHPVVRFFSAGAGAGAVPAFVLLLAGLLGALGGLTLWLELVVRAAAVSAAVLFLPLSLAALVWPAVSHWCRRLVDTLAALILSKLVVAAVLSLGVAAMAGGLGQKPTGGGFAAVMTGLALLVVATMSPFTLLKLVPAVEAGAIAHLEATRHRLQQAALLPVRGARAVLDEAAGGGLGAAAGGLGAGSGALAGAAASIGEEPAAGIDSTGIGNRVDLQTEAEAAGVTIPDDGRPEADPWYRHTDVAERLLDAVDAADAAARAGGESGAGPSSEPTA